MNELCAALTVGESAESHPAVALNPGWRFRRGLRKPQRPHWVANAEMLSLTARRRLVRSRNRKESPGLPEVGYAAHRARWQNRRETCRFRRSRP